MIKSISLLKKDNLAVLAHTDRGSLLHYSIHLRRWKLLEENQQFGSYAVMSTNNTLVALGNTKGRFFVR